MATLINVATPGPALAVSTEANLTTSPYYTTSCYTGASDVTFTLANTAYNLDSKSLTAGTWLVLGLIWFNPSTGTGTGYLSATTASTTLIAPCVYGDSNGAVGTPCPPYIIAATIKLAVTTTIYLNGAISIAARNAQGGLIAVRIA